LRFELGFKGLVVPGDCRFPEKGCPEGQPFRSIGHGLLELIAHLERREDKVALPGGHTLLHELLLDLIQLIEELLAELGRMFYPCFPCGIPRFGQEFMELFQEGFLYEFVASIRILGDTLHIAAVRVKRL